MERVPELLPDAREALGHLERGDYGAAVKSLDRTLARGGLVPSSTPNSGTIDVSDDGMVMTSHSGNTINARAFRNWGGSIRLSTKVASEVKAYTEAARGHDPQQLEGALKRHAEALYQHRQKVAKRAGKKWPQIKDKIPNGDAQWKRIGALHKSNAAGVRTVVHEVLHGFSPLEASAYRGAAGQVEEVTTEVMARVMSRDLFGIPMIGHAEGSYAHDIEAATEAIRELTGASHERAYEQLQTAAERFKRREVKVSRPEDAVWAFANDIGKVTGKPALQAEDVLERHLAAAARRTAKGSAGGS